MTAPAKSYRRAAERRWGRRAEWILGDGPWAVVARCRVPTVTLWPTYEEAVRAKGRIDRGGCGGFCGRYHDLVDLTGRSRATTREETP